MSAAAPAGPARRFWSERDANLRLDAGYLADPEGPYAAFMGPNPAISLDRFDDLPCVALLGEPGSGKTTALREEIERLISAAETARGDTAEVTLHFDLRDYADVADLRAAVFQHADVVRWKAGTHRLTLALDSLDEALIEMRKLATRLASEIRELPIERLRVRIACRTADWPSVLQREFNALWGEKAMRVLEIAPLRRRDVFEIVAATLGEERAGEFMDGVATQNAEPFAAKPGTLNFLMSSFAESGQLPDSQVELYRIGCLALCEETSESRRAARRTGDLSAAQRMAIAERVTAALIFGGRAAVWTGLDRDVPPSDLRRSDLFGDEPTTAGIVRVDEAVLRDEVLSTGLFTARGPERLGCAHQTYGEFLAARWIVRRGLTTEQVLALVTMNDHMGRKLVPQLREAAAWIASIDHELFDAIMDVEPSVLLKSDVAQSDAESLERLVQALLGAAERNTLPVPEFGESLRYRRLRHPELGKQLQAVIADDARPTPVRDLALRIAIACETREIAAAAADLALDSSATLSLRATAAGAVAVAGDEAEAARLLPHALGSEPDDKADELKGNALRATWHTVLPADLFASLSRAKRPNWAGAYEVFLRELAVSLTDEHVVPGLQWLERLGHVGSPGEQALEAAVITRAFGRLDDPEVCNLLLGRIRGRLRRYEPLISDRDDRTALMELLASPAIRHRLLAELVGVVIAEVAVQRAAIVEGQENSPPDADAAALRGLHPHVLADFGYIRDEDFAFVLDSLARCDDSCGSSAARLVWRELAQRMFDVRRADHADAVLQRASAPAVYDTFEELINPVDLRGPQAEAARSEEREREAERRKWAELREKRERDSARRAVRRAPLPSAKRLAKATRTTADPKREDDLPRLRWVKVYYELARDEHGNIPIGGESGDARAGVAWREAGEELRLEVIDAAEMFVALAVAPVLDSDFDVQHHRYAWAGYTALRLLVVEAPDRLDHLEVEAWMRWAPTVALAEPYGDAPEEQEAHVALARRARHAARELFDASVLDAVDYALGTVHWRVPRRVVAACAKTPLGAEVLAHCLGALESDLREAVADEMAGSLISEVPGSAWNEVEKANDDDQRALARKARAVTFVALLVALLRGGSAETRVALVGMFEKLAPSFDLTSPEAERALIAGQALLLSADDAGWGVISPVSEAAPEFAKELFLRTARDREVPIKNPRERLGVRGVGELFLALTKAFPSETDPWHNGVFSPNARDHVATWRRAMLTTLEEWGSPEAIAELQRIQTALPHYDWLGYSLTSAREQQGRAAWQPVSPADLFTLANNHERRLVRNGDQLLDLVVDSLGRYERELQGDQPAVGLLWIPAAGTKQRPREEAALADDIARHLRRDLAGRAIVTNLEVVLRRGGEGRAAGLRTDIHVTATLASGEAGDHTRGALVTLIIEVKGSWHREVLTAMRTQLVEGYLREHAGAHHGIYVVGYFTCDAWADCAESRRSRRLGDKVALKEHLDAQAENLSQGGVHVRAVVLDASLPAA